MILPDDTFDKLGVQHTRFYPMEPKETSSIADGSFVSASLGPTLWRGVVSLKPYRHATAAEILSLLERMDSSNTFFKIYDIRKPYPAQDPNGGLVSGYSPTVSGFNLSNNTLSVQAAPPNYPLSVGDLIGWTYASNPTRFALHRIVDPGTSDGVGNISNIEVHPAIRTGIATSDPVTFVKPVILAQLKPGSIEWGQNNPMFQTGIQFEFVQTLRGS